MADCVTGRLPVQSTAVVIAGIAAAWTAADSTGFCGHALRHALTYFLLGIALVAALPWTDRTWKNWAILAAGVVLASALCASLLPTVNVLGVALLLATLAYLQQGLSARAILISSLAVLMLAVFRLASIAIPTVWQLSDMLGFGMGKLAGWITGRPLLIGATFGGTDFLVLMIALYVGWLYSIAPPKLHKAVYAGTTIALAHLAYLVMLAYSEKIASLLPDPYYLQETDISRVGVWAWQNALRSFVPWNLPIVAIALQAIVACCMFRWADWSMTDDLKQQKNVQRPKEPEVVDLRTFGNDFLFQFGPVILAVLIAFITSFSLSKSILKGKTIVAYDKGNISSLKPEHDNSIEGGYGLLPIFVESLGGRFVKSPALDDKDLSKADVLIILHPNSPFTPEQLKRIENYVRRGGSLLLGAENFIKEDTAVSHFNDLLEATAMEVRYDTVSPLSGKWEQSYQAFSHPATLGLDDLRNRFGFQRGSSIQLHWPARPILLGRWGWSTPGSDAAQRKSTQYEEGLALGDIVLAAEQDFGKGKIVVIGDMSCMNNERLSCSWEFIGRLLGYFANRSSSPQAPWRQASGIVAMALFILLLAINADAARIAVAIIVLAVALVSCTSSSKLAGQVLPDGRLQTPNNLAYIDDSHLEAFSSDLWNDYGIAGFTRVLMRNGYLPLRLPDFTPEHLERAGLLVCMAPARKFSPDEKESLHRFVEQGGTSLFLVGAEEVRPVMALLKEFQFNIPPSPIRSNEEIREPEPLGAFRQIYSEANNSKHYINFYAAWPLKIENQDASIYVYWSDEDNDHPVVAAVPVGSGVAAVISDTNFAINLNIETLANQFPDNINFWRWLLPWITGKEPWNPPPEPIREQGPAEMDSESN